MKKLICAMLLITCMSALNLLPCSVSVADAAYKCNMHPDTPLREKLVLDGYSSKDSNYHYAYYTVNYYCDVSPCNGRRVGFNDGGTQTERHDLGTTTSTAYQDYNANQHKVITYTTTFCKDDCGYSSTTSSTNYQDHYSTARPTEFCSNGTHVFRKICVKCSRNYIHHSAPCDGVNHPSAPLSVPGMVR